ncbi:MAG TPA: HAMP domain-containing histidine kinase [Clostridiaceae bacterium]|nr:HAMP domain-containing histidine kinase [Clostridiaceae bacterium]
MKNESQTIKKTAKRRLTSLLFLVLFVFVILLVSIIVSGSLSYLLINAGILPPLYVKRFPVVLVFLLLVSLFIGTLIAILGGEYFLRSLHDLIEATKEVTAGNYNVKIKTGGTLEIDRLATYFNEMTTELASIEKLRNDFISNISHEFKTPIVSIRGFARRLKKSTLTEQQREEYLDIIIAETERLTRMSSNVMLLSKLENTENFFEKSCYFLDEQIRKVILLLKPQIEKKCLELEINLESMQVIGNEEMMNHVWINLLENAVKFSPEGSTIEIILKSNGNYAEVSISDEGIGMDDDTKKHIFEKFYQGDNSRITEGSGLGLSLVKRILQLCEGRIAVESTPGKGSRFTVSLPAHH